MIIRDVKPGSSFHEDFSDGGDLIIRSCDNVDFSVHSVLLSLASPVFSDMLKVGSTGSTNPSRQDPVPLGETAEMVALMLNFIYPLPPPPISSFDQLNQAFDIVDKYQLKSMKLRLQERMTVPNSPVSISADPLRAWAIAATHGLKAETDAAMSLAAKHHDFQQADGLMKLAETIPSTLPLIKLIGVPSARTLILADVLLSFHKDPMRLNDDNCRWDLCHFCFDMYFDKERYSAYEWQARWAYAVFVEIKGLPVREWDPFFKIGFFNTALHRNGGVPIKINAASYGDCGCIDEINGHPDLFEEWASTVHEHLKTRLRSLDQLEQLNVT